MRYKHGTGVGASIILGLVFVIAGLGKLLGQAESFDTIFNPFPDVLSQVFTGIILTWLPYIEIVLGLLLILGVFARLLSLFSAVLVFGFIVNNSWLLSRGLGYEPCSCLGIVESIIQVELSSTGALYMDVAMLALVVVISYCYQGRFLSIYPWFLRRG